MATQMTTYMKLIEYRAALKYELHIYSDKWQYHLDFMSLKALHFYTLRIRRLYSSIKMLLQCLLSRIWGPPWNVKRSINTNFWMTQILLDRRTISWCTYTSALDVLPITLLFKIIFFRSFATHYCYLIELIILTYHCIRRQNYSHWHSMGASACDCRVNKGPSSISCHRQHRPAELRACK